METKEFERWASRNYNEFLNLFKKIENHTINELKNKGHIYKRKNKQIFS